MSESFEITAISLGERIIRLSTPAILEYSRQGEYLIGYCAHLEISILGETLENLIEEFRLELEVTWEQYAEGEDHLLTSAALELKQTLLKMARN